jgi:hypothetical protein
VRHVNRSRTYEKRLSPFAEPGNVSREGGDHGG